MLQHVHERTKSLAIRRSVVWRVQISIMLLLEPVLQAYMVHFT